jgi:outer membrane lipoprotein-sorting protein
MKIIITVITTIILLNGLVSCRSTKKLQSAISSKDTAIVRILPVETDSAKGIAGVMENIEKNHIDFNTFSAKIKVDYTDSRGRQPDVNAFVRIKKDSLIWISINATFLNVEAFRVLISKDSVWILNKLQRQVEFRSLDYLEEVAKIPLDFKTLQDLIIGNPIFLGKKIVAFKQTENRILISTIDDHFKNLLTLAASNNLIERSKLDDINVALNRTGDLTYYNYEDRSGVLFSTLREITVAEKTRVDITLDFKQYEFNKDLSFPFSIPKNFNRK